MTRPLCFLLLCASLLLSATAQAQAQPDELSAPPPPPPAEAPATEAPTEAAATEAQRDTPSPPPLVSVPETGEGPKPEPPAPRGPSASELNARRPQKSAFAVRAPRIAAELLAGSILGAGFGAVGAVAGCAVDSSAGIFGCLGGLVIGGIVGSFTGVLTGTLLAGWLLDGSGSAWATGLGEVVGAIAGVLVLSAVTSTPGLSGDPLARVAAVAFLLGAPLIGAAAGFELSSEVSRAEANRMRSVPVSLRPVLAPTERGGAMVGFVGRF